MYSQNEEEKYIVDFFDKLNRGATPPKWVIDGRSPCLLDIGANDGKTFSNSLRLIELDWEAVLVEPSNKASLKLYELHKENDKVQIINAGISDKEGIYDFWESDYHLPSKEDVALLSTFSDSHKVSWASSVDFKKVYVHTIKYDRISDNYKPFDFITIDAEGLDLIILKQIDLTHTKLLCIEWNSIEQTKKEILNYTLKFGMNKIIYQSPENLLICR